MERKHRDPTTAPPKAKPPTHKDMQLPDLSKVRELMKQASKPAEVAVRVRQRHRVCICKDRDCEIGPFIYEEGP